MKTTFLALSGFCSLALVIACTHSPDAPLDAPIATVAPTASAPVPPPDAPRDITNAFPAGPGVTLLSDQFQALVRERQVTDRNVPFEQRLALAEQVLGKGEPFHDPLFDGVAWRAIGTRTSVAPFSCQELVLSRKGPASTMRPVDNALCGLPYSIGELTKAYNGPAPKRTAFRLDEVLNEAGVLPPDQAVLRARTKLGPAEGADAGESVWYGIAGRSKEAPISCKALRLGGRPRIDDAPLSACNLAWPTPGMTFEKTPDTPVIDKQAALAQCANQCTTTEVCMIDQRMPALANVHGEADGSRARYPDGRPAPVTLVPSCVAIPKTCTKLESDCFFQPLPRAPGPLPTLSTMAGPCPQDTYSGRGFMTNPQTHIMCFSRIGQTPFYPRTPVTVPPVPPSSVPQTRGASPSKPKASSSALDVQILF